MSIFDNFFIEDLKSQITKRLNVIDRTEFETQARLLQQIIEKVAELEQQVLQLEARLVINK